MTKISDNFSRRRFISTAAMAGVSIPIYNIAGKEIFNFQSVSTGKIHIFSKPLQWLGYDDLASVLQEAGADGIDLSVRPGGHVLPENVETDLPKAFEAARRKGLSIDMIVTGITTAGEKYTEPIIRTASSLGIKFYRMGYINYNESQGVWGTLQNYKPELKKLGEMNRKYSIHGAYQNHFGTRVGGPVWDLYELLKDLDPQFIGCQYDVRHAMAEGGSSWVNGLKLILPWVKCTDIKDFKWSQNNGRWNPESVPIGEGMVNFDEYFKIVKKANITGPMSIHLEYPPFERYTVQMTDAEKRKLFITAMKKDIDKLKSFRTKFQL
jgi:L-ribulose-5-phosphate 3-epimerase